MRIYNYTIKRYSAMKQNKISVSTRKIFTTMNATKNLAKWADLLFFIFVKSPVLLLLLSCLLLIFMLL